MGRAGSALLPLHGGKVPPAVDFDQYVESERQRSPRYGGRTVKGWAAPRQQLGLPLARRDQVCRRRP